MKSTGLRDGPNVKAEEGGKAENGFSVLADGWMVVPFLTCTVSRGELAGPVSVVFAQVPEWVAELKEPCSSKAIHHEGPSRLFAPTSNIPSFLAFCRCKHPHD